MDTDPPISRPHRGDARRADLGERLAELPPLDEFVSIAEKDARYRRAIAACPAEFRGWLTGIADETLAATHERVDRAAAGLIAPHYSDVRDADALFGRIDCLGLTHGILAHWENDRGNDYALVPLRIAQKLAGQVLDDPHESAAELLALALLAVACSDDAASDARLRRALEWGGEAAFLAAAYLVTRNDESDPAESEATSHAIVDCLLDALTCDWPDLLWGRDWHRRAADRAADMLRRQPLAAIDRDRLHAALSAYAGEWPVLALELWWHVGGRFGDCPVSIPDVIRTDPFGWVRFYATQPHDQFSLEIHTRTLASGCLTAHGSDRAAYLAAVHTVCDAERPADELLPALAGALADEPADEVRDILAGCWADYLARIAAQPGDWTAWDTWIASLLRQRLGGLNWLVFADWLEENGHAVAAAVARGDAERERESDGWRRLFEWVAAPPA